MPPSKYIRDLQKAIRATHGCGSRHFTTIPVTEKSGGEIIWQGDVEVFDLVNHPKAQCCYAWSYHQAGAVQTMTILGTPSVSSAEDAVRAALATK